MEIETLDGQPVGIVTVGQPWRARIGFRVVSAQRQFVIGLGLKAADGAAIQTAWYPPEAVAPGDYEVIFSQSQVCLEAGTYTVIVGLNESDRCLQQIEAARLDITSENPAGYFPFTSGAGTVLNSMPVTLRRL